MSAQAMEALAHGNELRIGRANIKKEIAALGLDEGTDRACAILRDPSELEGGIRLNHLLGAVHRLRRDRINRALYAAGMHPGRMVRRVDELSERERASLAAALSYAPRKKAGR